MTRLYAVLLLAVVLSACGDDDPALAPDAPTVEAETPLGPGPASEAPPDSAVTPDVARLDDLIADAPAADAPLAARPPAPAPTPDVEAPVPAARPPAAPAPPRAPARQPETPAVDRSGAEQLWTRFQSALRARDVSRIGDVLHTTVRVRGQDYDRDGPQVQEVVRQFAENPDLADAYLAASADELAVDGDRATFASRASYTLEGVDYEVTVFGTMREVSPGTWRIVELGSRE